MKTSQINYHVSENRFPGIDPVGATRQNRRFRTSTLLAWSLALLLSPALLLAAEGDGQTTAIDESAVDTAYESELTITAEPEDDAFTSLPPRDLVAHPLTETLGLETATSVIGRKEIELQSAYSVVDAMKYLPGAWTETRGRKVKQFFSVRGQRYPYPSYAIDGAWLREFHETNYFFNAANVERIEVVRSSGSLLLSPGGMTGVINIIPRRSIGPETRWDNFFGSQHTYRTHLYHGNGTEAFNYAMGLGYRHTDGVNDKNGEENITDLYGGVTFKPHDDLSIDFNMFMLYGNRQLELAEPPASNRHQTRRQEFDPLRSMVLTSTIRYQASEQASSELTLNYACRNHNGHEENQADWEEKDHEYGARFIQSLKLTDENTLRFGGLVNHWECPTGKRFYVGREAEMTTLSGVIVDEHDFGQLKVDLGYRLTGTHIEDFGGFNIEGSPRGVGSARIDDEWDDPLHTITMGSRYELTEDWALLGNFAWGQVSSHPGLLNTNLERPDNESRYKWDVGISYDWAELGTMTLTGFWVRQDDAALLSGGTIVSGADEYALYENADRDNYGIEFDMRSKRFDNGLQFFFNCAAMETRRKDDTGWEDDEEVPNVILGGGASCRVGDLELVALVKNVSEYENERFLPGGTPPAPLGDFIELTTKLFYYFGDEKQSKAFVGFENVCNDEYSTVAGYPNVGCRFQTGVSLVF